MHRSLISHRALRLGLALVVVVLISGLGARAASAAAAASTKTCADQVIADWYDDGRVGKIYPLSCYRQAISKLPPDVLDYSNAKEEIARALAFAKQGKQDPGGGDPSPATTATTSTQETTGGTDTTKTTKTSTSPTIDTTTIGTTTTDTSGPSSVPVPLLVLGGLAVLLLAAGSAGYLRRRMGNGDDGDGMQPPAPPDA